MNGGIWDTCMLFPGFSRGECASWVQAWGSIGAILFAVFIAWRQERQHIVREKRVEHGRLVGAMSILRLLSLDLTNILSEIQANLRGQTQPPLAPPDTLRKEDFLARLRLSESPALSVAAHEQVTAMRNLLSRAFRDYGIDAGELLYLTRNVNDVTVSLGDRTSVEPLLNFARKIVVLIFAVAALAAPVYFLKDNPIGFIDLIANAAFVIGVMSMIAVNGSKNVREAEDNFGAFCGFSMVMPMVWGPNLALGDKMEESWLGMGIGAVALSVLGNTIAAPVGKAAGNLAGWLVGGTREAAGPEGLEMGPVEPRIRELPPSYNPSAGTGEGRA